MKRQFTATVYIVEKESVLLILHRKFQKWLPPGGHVDDNELPHEAALREAYEETGLEVELMLQENIFVDRWNAKSIPRPYLCLLEEIPSFKGEEAHQHIDFIFLAKPLRGELTQNDRETTDLRWFTRKEIENLVSDEEIFHETKEVILHLLDKQLIIHDEDPNEYTSDRQPSSVTKASLSAQDPCYS